MILRARRRGIVKREYEVSTSAETITSLVGGRRESCEFSLSGEDFRIERDGRGRFLLFGPDGRVATAERQTGREWAVQAASGNLKLVKPSIWRSGWEVRQRGSRKGEIRHDGAFTRTYTAEMPGDVPSPVAVFALYVVLVIFERAAASAAAA